MPISYDEALRLIECTAEGSSYCRNKEEATVSVPLVNATNQTLACDIHSTCNVPKFDTSAMDGFAISSVETECASEENPIRFAVHGLTAAGDLPFQLAHSVKDLNVLNLLPTVEIMTGAPFPVLEDGTRSTRSVVLDACVPIEHVSPLTIPDCHHSVISLTRPIRKNQHRRRAGEDFRKGDVVARKGAVVTPQLVMALAAVGITEVVVARKIRAGVWSTGSEVLAMKADSVDESNEGEQQQARINDANAPFLVSALRQLGLEVEFLGVLRDHEAIIEATIARAVQSGSYDVLLTTGAVSAGKFDHVKEAVEGAGLKIVFHKVAMRPGHPILFASSSSSTAGWATPSGASDSRTTAFFGLPGNPVAAAACLKFLVEPYLLLLDKSRSESSILAKIATPAALHKQRQGVPIPSIVITTPMAMDVFRHGTWRFGEEGMPEVEFSAEQSPSRMSAFSQANCWVHIPQGIGDVVVGQRVRCYPLTPYEFPCLVP